MLPFLSKIISSGRDEQHEQMAYRSIPVLGIAFLGNSSLIARKLKILISTRRILVLVVVFSFQILLEKVLKKWQLLVESWFWLLFFLFKFYLKKC